MNETDQPSPLRKIVSGGQTGVDRAALDVAISLGIPHGGWCPRGRLAEDGPIGAEYQLDETESADYPVRTEQNVLDSDGTLIFYRDRLIGGTALTRRLAKKHSRPCFLVNLDGETTVDAVCGWISDNRIEIVNVAGPRESTSPGIYRLAKTQLRRICHKLKVS